MTAMGAPRRFAVALRGRPGRLRGLPQDIATMIALFTAPQYCGCVAIEGTGIECASESALRQHLRAALRDWASNDQLVFYFTGHGTFVGDTYALALDLDANPKECITFDELEAILTKAGVRSAILILDTCWSGSAADKDDPEFFRANEPPEGIAILCSSGPQQKSRELADGSASAFTSLVFEAVSTGLDNRPTPHARIGVHDVIDYVRGRLNNHPDAELRRQQPRLKMLGAPGSVWFARNVSGALADTRLETRVTSEAELKLLYDQTRKEEHPVARVNPPDLDSELVAAYCRKRHSELAGAALATMLDAIKAYSTIPLGGVPALTRSAVLSFAQRPSDFLVGALAVFEDSTFGEGQFERIDVIGPVSMQIAELTRLAASRLRVRSEISAGGERRDRPEVDTAIVRELVSNAVLHRSYESGDRVHVRLTHDAIEIRSPGTMPITWAELVHADVGSMPVNPRLSFLQSGLPAFEGIGRGARIVRDYLAAHGEDAIQHRELPGERTLIRIRRPQIAAAPPPTTDGVIRSPAVTDFSPVFNAPVRRSQAFVGREDDLARLDAALRSDSVRVTASVEGLAGVGKTELVLQLIDRLSRTDRFPGGIFWLDAEQPDLTSTWGGPIADALGVYGGTVQDRAAMALRAVASARPALVVLDNVTNWTTTTEPHPLPSGSQVTLLVTTRRAFLGGRNAFQHVNLDCLDEGAARDLLITIAGRDLAQERGLDELLAHLGGHTLAVELAGAFLAEYEETTVAAYLARLRGGEDVDEKVRAQVRYEQTVRQALDASWERLDNAARRAWLVASMFAPTEATVALLRACDVDEDAQRALRQHHILRRNGDRWSMHRLVREYGRRAGTDHERAQAERVFVVGCVAVARHIDLATGFQTYRADRPHLDQAVELAGTALAMAPDVRSELLDRVGTGAHSAGDLPRAKDLLERALASDLSNLGDDHPAVATRRSNLALVLKDLGDLPRAKNLLERALASDLANLGEDHPNVATSRSNLALVLKDLGDLPRAKDLLERALASDLSLLGEDHPAVATRRANLAMVLQDLGDLPRAKNLLERALASDLILLGEDHPNVASSRSNLAMVLKDLGDLPRAKDLLERAIASNLKLLGEDHPHVATCRSNLAVVLKDLGDLPRAKDLLERALASNLKLLGEDHPHVATCRSNLASVLHALGDLPRAKYLLERALASNVKLLGENHPSVAATRAKLARLRKELKDLPQARAL